MAPEKPVESNSGLHTASRHEPVAGPAFAAGQTDSPLLAADRRGERRTALVQALLALLTLLFCQAMTRPYGADMVLTCGVAVLLVNAIARYQVCGMRRLPERALDVLTVLDLLVAVCLLWSVSVAVSIAKGASVEAPSIVLLIGMIAARILRTHPRPVLIAGISAAVGWSLALVALSSEIFVASHRIALWTEAERIVGLLIVSGILAVAAHRTRRLIAGVFALSRSGSINDCAATTAVAPNREGEETQSERLSAAMDTISVGLVLIDGKSRVVSVNEPFRKLHGIDVALLPDMPITDFIAHLGKGLASADQAQLAQGFVSSVDDFNQSVIKLQNGKVLSVRVRPMPDGSRVVTHEDVSELHDTEARLVHLAEHDPLTGLANRPRFLRVLSDLIDTAQADDEAVVLLLLDIDRFKEVNDLHGSDAGDCVLRSVAVRLTAIRGIACIARTGADEFAIAAVSSHVGSSATALWLVRQIDAEIAKPITVGDLHVRISASTGIARAPADAMKADDLLHKADLALIGAKADGHSGHRFFEVQMDQRLARRRRLTSDLRAALEGDQFDLHYQPQLDLKTGRIVGFEALIRWEHPILGSISPAEFIPIAEQTGMIRAVGRFAIERACRDAVKWPSHLSIAVNVSAAEFKPGLVDTVRSVLAETGLPASRLELEITETVLIDEASQALSILSELRERGVRVALDDFGTGYSSLSYLRMFPFNKIKIDRSFVADLAAERTGALSIIRSIAFLGSSLGMQTTAEGVETTAQLDVLRSEGCTQVQGFLLSRARRADDLGALLGQEFTFANTRSAAASAA
jgi:diguanylate cyclase (GGDEF)-like protein